ncbi:MAG: hypothetical protein V4576_00670 [Patescibacteria group bacterium]
MNILEKRIKSILIYTALFGVSAVIPHFAHAQTTSIGATDDFYQYLLQQQAANEAAQSQTLGTFPSTATTTVIEDIIYQKNALPVTTQTAQAIDKTVVLGDDVTISLKSKLDPATPIDLFVLAYTASGFPSKRVFLKTVFNEQQNVVKKYKLTINEDLLADLENAATMRIGYCLGGCKVSIAKLIAGKVILPVAAPILVPATQPDTQQTF